MSDSNSSAAIPPGRVFAFCPRCGATNPETDDKRVGCASCDLRLYLNTTVAVGVLVIRDDASMLFIRRGRDPGKGMLALPGGFVDPGENAEDAAHREVMEEVGLTLAPDPQLLCTFPNSYEYRGIIYSVCDIFLTARPAGDLGEMAQGEVTDVVWLDPSTVNLDEIAFPSMRRALMRYRESQPA